LEKNALKHESSFNYYGAPSIPSLTFRIPPWAWRFRVISILGNISREEAMSFLDATRKVILKAQEYLQGDVEILEKLYEQTIHWLRNYSREEIERILRNSRRN